MPWEKAEITICKNFCLSKLTPTLPWSPELHVQAESANMTASYTVNWVYYQLQLAAVGIISVRDMLPPFWNKLNSYMLHLLKITKQGLCTAC